MPFYPVLGEGSPTKIDYTKNGRLILTSLLENLVTQSCIKLKPWHGQPLVVFTGQSNHSRVFKVVQEFGHPQQVSFLGLDRNR